MVSTSHSARSVLRYLAELAPAGSKVTTDVVVGRVADFAYLGWRPDLIYQPNSAIPGGTIPRIGRSKEIRRLAAVDALHDAEQLLRIGWLFVSGHHEVDGESRRFCLPLLSCSVRLQPMGRNYKLVQLGDFEMPTDFFSDQDQADLEDWRSLERELVGMGPINVVDTALLEQLPLFKRWVVEATIRGEFHPAFLAGSERSPVDMRSSEMLHIVAGAAVYAARDVNSPNVAATLLGWMSQPLGGTAFDVLYGVGGSHSDTDDAGIETPLPLNESQRQAVARFRREPITVVSGPPGTGKSHLVAAAAIDEVARGNSVLVATQSDYAAGVIAGMLRRYPGPRFVRFGSRDDRESVAAELSDGLAQPFSGTEYDTRHDEATAAASAASRVRRALRSLLEREISFSEGLARRQLNSLVAVQAPAVLDEDFDISRANRLLERTRSAAPLIGPFLAKRALHRLRRLVRADAATAIDDLEAAVAVAVDERNVRRGLAGGGLTLESPWQELEKAEAESRAAVGRAIEARRRSRSNSRRKSTKSVATLASALRSGTAKRRQLLTELSGGDFLDVLPLWVGTLQDIDNTLPVAPGMFDVVIFDEASQIDQMRAAPGLARAKRAMVVGDPRQLRHVSFISDDAMEEAAASASLRADDARILDVRRNSLFDAAASISPITWLDEHFRSVPHIIGFSDRSFYSGKLRLMTQHPATESRDAIRTVLVAGDRNADGVNEAEIDVVLDQVKALGQAGVKSIGVVSPFRAQADAIEEALLKLYGPEDVGRLGLRVGTVHAFQGSEREVVVASLAIGLADLGGSLRFLQNPNLFNVMVTRARREMIVVTSIDPESLPDGLLADYLRHADHPPLPSESEDVPPGWSGEVYRELVGYGVPVTANYPVAGWSVDLAVGEQNAAIGVETRVHPGGADLHIEQHMALRRAGWVMVDAFESRWLTDAEGAAQMLSKRLLRSSADGSG